MKAIAVLAVMLWLSPVPARAQDTSPSPERTAAPSDARFEVLQSPLAAKDTYRIDKYTGTVWQLVTASGDPSKLVWQQIEAPAAGSDVLPGRVNYQMFTSGLAVRHTYLMNVHSGATWVLRQDTNSRALFLAPVFNASRDKLPEQVRP